MSRTRKIVATGLAASALVVAFGGVAGAQSQYVEATVVSGISVVLDTAVATDGGTNLSPGSTATIDGGTLTVSSNGLYSVDVDFDKLRMTEWVSGAYVASSPKALTAPITLTATPSGGLTGAGVGTATSAEDPLNSGTALGGTITGISLLGSGTYALSYSQVIGYTDAPATYRIQATYTGNSL